MNPQTAVSQDAPFNAELEPVEGVTPIRKPALRQQINLYEAPPEPDVWRDYSPFPQVGAGLVLMLALVYLFTLWSHWGLQDQLQEVQQQYQLGQQNIDKLKQQLPAPVVDNALLAEVSALEQREKAGRELLKALNVERIGNADGFSGYLEGLARRHSEGLWFTRIELQQGGAWIGLQGQTARPEWVPQLIRNLGQEPVFSGTEFDIFNLTTGPAGRVMSFEVRAEQELH